MGKSSKSPSSLDELLQAMRSPTSGILLRKYEEEIRKLMTSCGTPLVRNDQAHFLFDTAAHPHAGPVYAVGDWNNWQKQDPLKPLNPKSTLVHLMKTFPIDARFAYRLLIEGHDSLLDPNNRNAEQEVFGTNSVLRMSAYHTERLADEPGPSVVRGRVKELEVNGHKGANKRNYTRTVYVYIPPETKKLASLPVLYVHDGSETLIVGKFLHILDNLYHREPLLPRCAVVFVPPVERDREYMLHPGYAHWFANHLVPTVETKMKLKPDAAHRGTLGSSLGGLLSAQLGFLHPKVFGAIAAQSPAFWVQDNKIVAMFQEIRKLPLRWFIHTGTVNDAQTGSRKMLKVLQDKDYPVTYRETSESHNWGNWRGTYAEILRWFVASNEENS